MATRYYARVLEWSGSVVAFLATWRRLSYTKRVNAPDSYVLELDDSDIADSSSGGGTFGSGLFGSGTFGNPGGGATSGRPSVFFVTDALIEVWREDRAAVPPIVRYKDLDAFHRTGVRQTLSSGLETFTSYGAGMADLLKRRAILYPAQSAGAMKTGAGETVMKAFVDENAGPSATMANGRLADGVTSGLTVEADTGAGSAWEGSRENKGLLETCQEIAVATLVDFGVLRSNPPDPLGFLFRAKAYPWGDDRTTVGLVPATGRNAAGNVPVVFSVGFANMGAPVYSLNRGSEVNAVIVLGQGLESMRAFEERTNPTAIAASPWNRREAVRNANQEAAAAGLQTVGDAALIDLQAHESFTFSVLQTNSCRYGRDYDVGDTVTTLYHGTERHYQVRSATVTVQGGSEQIEIEVANAGS